MPTLFSDIPPLLSKKRGSVKLVATANSTGSSRSEDRTKESCVLECETHQTIPLLMQSTRPIHPNQGRPRGRREVAFLENQLQGDPEFQGISQLSESHNLQSSLSASSGIGRFRLDDDLLYCSTCGDFRSSSPLHSVAVFRCLPSRPDHVRFAAHGETS